MSSGLDLVFLGGEVGQAPLDLARRRLRRHAVQVGAGRGRGRRGVRHLAGVGRRDLHLVEVDLELLGHHLRDLDVQALPHLGAAVVQVHAAVGVDVHQRAGLVEVRGGEGDAELHRRQRDAPLEIRILPVPLRNLLPAGAIAAALLKLRDQLRQDVVLDLHVVGRDVPWRIAVEVGPPHLERVEPALARDLVHHPLDADHALRAAEAAEGGVGDRVGLAALRADAHRLEEVAVVGVEHARGR